LRLEHYKLNVALWAKWPQTWRQQPAYAQEEK